MRREPRKLAVWVALRFGKYIPELPERIKERRNFSYTIGPVNEFSLALVRW